MKRAIAAAAVTLCVAGGAMADQTGIRSYDDARKVFWGLYPNGGTEIYCGGTFRNREGLNIEHALPAARMTDFLGCGSRKACRRTSARFNRMEADLHNHFPSLVALNSKRQDYPYWEIPGEPPASRCDFEFDGASVEPRAEARGDLARGVLYMEREYGVPLGPAYRDMLVRWHRADPPGAEERRRNDAIAAVQGTRNPFVDETGAAPFAAAAPGVRPAASVTLKIATWNMGWLTGRAAEINADMEAHGLKGDVYQRKEADFRRLRDYARSLDADVVALQEIDDEAAARKVFDPADYDVVLTGEADYQRPGFAVRKGLPFVRNGDLEALDLRPNDYRSLRRGADITVAAGAARVRLLSVHLKSGCFSDTDCRADAKRDLEAQMPVLAKWIDDRQAAGEAFAVLGDFNRRLNANDRLWRVIDNGPAGLVRATEGSASPCWGGGKPEFIDQVVLDRSLSVRAFGVLVYAETDRRLMKAISDHCPVWTEVRVSQPGS